MSNTRSKEVIQINPTNLGNGKFSFKNGTPQIEFDIPMMPKYMDGNSLRINGKLNIKLGNGNRPSNQDPANDATRGYLDPRTGVQSLFDYVSVANQEGQTYEMIKNYNRMTASLMSKETSLDKYLGGGENNGSGACGKNKQQGKQAQLESSFSVKLLCGFLNSEKPIDLHLVRGLHIVIQLAPDNFALQTDYWTEPTSNASNDMTYELSDLMLTFDALVPDAQEQEAMLTNTQDEWEYNSFSSFYNVMTSNDFTATMNINTSRTIGVTCNMIPSKFLNNYLYNSQMCLQTLAEDVNATANRLRVRVPVKEITFLRGGLRQPLDFEVVSTTSQTEQTADAQREWEATNSINEVWRQSHMIKDLTTQLSLPTTATATTGRYKTSVTGNDAIQSYHFGVSYDHLAGVGQNFKGSPLAVRFQSDLTSGEPHSIFTFVKHKNTIVFNNGAVQIQN